MKATMISVAFTLTSIIAASQSEPSQKIQIDARPLLSKNIFNLEYAHRWGELPKNGFAIAYMLNPGKKGIYYINSRLTILSDNKKTETLEWTFQSVTLSLSHRFFFARGNRALPFIELETGYMHCDNSASIPLVLGAKAPGIWGTLGFRYATGGEEAKPITTNTFVSGVSAGYLFRWRGSGLTAKVGYQFSGSFEFIDKKTVGTTANHTSSLYELGYDTYTSKPNQFTLTIGFLLGNLRNQSKSVF